MWVKWVNGIWDLLTIYGKNKVWQLLWDGGSIILRRMWAIK